MAVYALSWDRPKHWADRLRKPAGRAVSDYPSYSRDLVEEVAAHINSLNPEMDCKVEVLT